MLRRAGLDVHHGRLVDAVRALEWVNVGSRADTCRRAAKPARASTATRSPGSTTRSICSFKAHRPPAPACRSSRSGSGRASSSGPRPAPDAGGIRRSPGGIGGLDACGRRLERDRRVAHERLRRVHRHVSSSGPGALLEQLPWSLSRRRTRRWQRASSGASDLRRVLRRNVMRGDFVELPRRARRELPRPIVLLADVSGSMERYSRVLRISSTAWRKARHASRASFSRRG